ncbi:TRAP-type C4-dicarboxylate transport system substrate-binding protein [Spinactinospora alkalitolerans]|uniref:TRAP-type C4-dicarboxylate transport system substrate-binding protein n=1 Tax=Spinactinospora alkalitolerans TaxID=687207 RepID=A0A852U6L6_9ACTN|nr:TRAP transporter substrate-binding protein [Spinactinospora alkalitolerans]NYE50513.1 TRAP-type C4-dicarboxylate transport system substrate-binding protein [Spinactinospora alkalitolerans]
MSRRNRFIAAITASGTALLLTACMGGGGSAAAIAPDDEIRLSYAFFAPAASFPGVQMEEWADRLAERTDGQVTVQTYPGGTLMSAGDIYDGVSAGVVDVGLDSPAYDSRRFPFSSVINQPVGIESARVGSAAFLDLLLEYEPAEFDGYQIITAFTTEPAYLQTQTPVRSLSDLAGRDLRSSGATIPTLESLGASPLSLSMADVAENLQIGVIDGYVSSREVLRDFSLAEQVGYVTDYPFGLSNSFVAVMDQQAFDALPEHVQEAILDLREEMTAFASEFHDDENVGEAIAWARSEHGVETAELDPEVREELDARMERLTDDWVARRSDADFDAREVLDRMRELADQHAEELETETS